MEIGSSMASAVALSQGQARQEFGMAALAREAQSETSVANMVEKSVKDGNGQGHGGEVRLTEGFALTGGL